MALKHQALFGATAFLFVSGLGLGFSEAQVETADAAPMQCGSLLTPDATVMAFKYDVEARTGDSLAEVYADRCTEVRESRQVPTYSTLGMGVVGLLASCIVLGRGNSSFIPTA